MMLSVSIRVRKADGIHDTEQPFHADSHQTFLFCGLAAHFTNGTFLIHESGNYKLCEDIVFHPNGPTNGETPAEDAFDPIFDLDGDDNDEYDRNNFGLGFFSAIAITSSDVTLYLNDKTIEQSAGHALFQRFFAIIELANSPFIAGAGPAQFVGKTPFKTASNVKIIGPGTLGRSSHHGKYGNKKI